MYNLLIISLHASPSMAPGVSEWGGTHTYMKELLCELDYSKFNVVFVTRKVFEFQPNIEKINDNCLIINHTFGEFKNFDKRTISAYHNSNVNSLKIHLKKLHFKPDVIHSVYWNSGHIAYELSKCYSVPYVHSVISNGKGRILRGADGTAVDRIKTEELVFNNARYILCVSDSEKQDIINMYNIDPNKIFIAGQFVHPSFLYPPHNQYGCPRLSSLQSFSNRYANYEKTVNAASDYCPDKIAFTYVGRLHVNKGIEYIVRAWFDNYRKYKELCPPLWLVGGDSNDIDNMRSLLKCKNSIELESAEKADRLVWWGYLDEPGISALYTKTLCSVTNSLYEPGGRVAVEALCHGIPVIASENGFASDIICDWANGFLVQNGDTDKLSRRLEHFIKNPFLATIMRTDAQNSGLSTIRFWDFTNTHEKLYRAAVESEYVTPPDFPSIKHTYERRLEAYPFSKPLIDKTDVIEIALRLSDDVNINSVKHWDDELTKSSDIWTFNTDKDEYLLKFPFSRIEYRSMYNPFVNEIACMASRRYSAELKAAEIKGIAPIVASYSDSCVIVRKRYEKRRDFDLHNVIEDIERIYRDNPVSHIANFNTLDSLIRAESNIVESDKYFIEQCNGGFFENTDYSLRVEAIRWYNAYMSLHPELKDKLTPFFQQTKDVLFKAASSESTLKPIINLGGCDIKNLVFDDNKTMFVDNERAHFGWPGIDYADLIISYFNNHNFGISELEEFLTGFHSDYITTNILIGWLILSGWKTAISDVVKFEIAPSERISERNLYFAHFNPRLP